MSGKQQPIDLEPVLDWIRNNSTAGIGPAQASLAQPGQPPFEAATFEGDLVTKDVALTASMKSPQGETSTKNLTVSMARVAGTQAGVAREGRWLIIRISGL